MLLPIRCKEPYCFSFRTAVMELAGLDLFSLPTGPIIAAAVLGLITLYNWPIWSRRRYPPGPVPLPFLGNKLLFVKSISPGLRYFYGEF